MSHFSRQLILLLATGLILLTVLPACSAQEDSVHLSMLPLDKLPPKFDLRRECAGGLSVCLDQS